MSSDESTVRVDFRTFSLLLLLAAIPMLIGTWWLFDSHEAAELDVAGTHLNSMAETAFNAINGYLQNQIIAIAGLTEVNVLRDAVAGGNRDLHRDLAEVRKSIPRMDASWRSSDRTAPAVRAILENPASDFLRRYIAVNQYYHEIVITDFFGRVVAATSKTALYYWANEPWWQETYGDGFRGAVYISDVRYDNEAKSYLMDIAQPFVESEGGVLGIIRVVIDTKGIDSLVGSIRTGPAATVALIHARGDVISAPGYSSMRAGIFPSTLEILNAREKAKSYFVSSNPPGSVFGLTERGFPELYPHLNWIVVGTEKADNVLHPLRRLRTFVVAVIGGVFFAALVAALMLSRVEAKPIIEEDPHLEKL